MMLALAATTLLTACNENEMDNWNGEIRLSSGVTVQQTRATGTVPDTQIASGQQVGAFINDAGTATAISANLKYDTNGTGGLTLNATPPQQTPFYPATGNAVNIIAYHPYNASAAITGGSTFDFTVEADQSTPANYCKSDLLYSKKAEAYGRQSAAHSLTFYHKLSKLTYELVQGSGKPDLTGATVQWMNVEKAATFKAEDGTVGAATSSNVGTITPHATYGAIIVPQTVAASKQLLEVTLESGGTLYYSTPSAEEERKFEGGKKYHYKITVNLSSLSVESQVSPWTPVGDRTGTAEM